MTEKELAELDATMRENNRFQQKLEDKARTKGFIETNSGAYGLAKVGYIAICIFYVAFAWPWLAGIIAGHFSYVDPFFAKMLGGLIAVTVLGLIEWRRVINATALLEGHYFRNEGGGARLYYAAFFTILTAVMAFLGVPQVLDAIHPAPTPIAAVEKTQSLIDASYVPQIAAADKAAAAFFESRSWLGKLSDPDGKRHAKLLNAAASLRSDYSNALKGLEGENLKIRTDTDAINLQNAASYQSQRTGIVRTLAFFIIILEVLFWYCFNFKERFEYMAHLEMKLSSGKPGNKTAQGQNPPPNNQKPHAAAPPPAQKNEQQIIEEAAKKALQKIEAARVNDPAIPVTIDLFVNEMKLATQHNGSYASLPLGGGGK